VNLKPDAQTKGNFYATTHSKAVMGGTKNSLCKQAMMILPRKKETI
jgi:hypothetical protein